jgi:hypothetical protein
MSEGSQAVREVIGELPGTAPRGDALDACRQTFITHLNDAPWNATVGVK